MFEQIRAIVREEIQLLQALKKHPRNAIITSVDADSYSAKVRFEPHDPNDENGGESGWIPIQAVATGEGFGIYSLPKTGQQVEVNFQEGDHETGRIVQRHNSEARQPPKGMAPGEHWIVSEQGAILKFAQDGTLSIGGAGTQQQRQGKDASTGKDGTSQSNQQPQALQSLTMSPDGKLTIATPKGDFTLNGGKDIHIQPGGKLYLG